MNDNKREKVLGQEYLMILWYFTSFFHPQTFSILQELDIRNKNSPASALAVLPRVVPDKYIPCHCSNDVSLLQITAVSAWILAGQKPTCTELGFGGQYKNMYKVYYPIKKLWWHDLNDVGGIGTY